jgi:hypothetical protein
VTPAEIASIRAELESEQTWRQDEIRFLRNQLASFSNARQKMQFRRSLVVMLYAHYEGFCKFALERYVKAINAARLTCADATPAVVAGTWHQLFTAVESGDRKAKIFKSTLPHDERLHRFARRREFVEKLDELVKMPIDVPDGTVDTESNLWPIVMRKNLFLVGLDHDAFSKHDGQIQTLMNRRNNIAHGAEREGLRADDYEKLEKSVLKIMDDLMDLVMDAISKEAFRQTAAAVP